VAVVELVAAMAAPEWHPRHPSPRPHHRRSP
jgi:hypothetical protein